MKTNEEIADELVKVFRDYSDDWDVDQARPDEMLKTRIAEALAERTEECAKVCDGEEKRLDASGGGDASIARREADFCAYLIRGMFQVPTP